MRIHPRLNDAATDVRLHHIEALLPEFGTTVMLISTEGYILSSRRSILECIKKVARLCCRVESEVDLNTRKQDRDFLALAVPTGCKSVARREVDWIFRISELLHGCCSVRVKVDDPELMRRSVYEYLCGVRRRQVVTNSEVLERPRHTVIGISHRINHF